MSVRIITLVAALLSTGLMAGLFFGWMVSVIPGTAAIDDRSYVVTMQNINREIVNPAFVIPFIITPALLTLAAVFQFRAGQSRRGVVLLVAAATYLVGVLGVTMGRNVPLNNTLDVFNLEQASDLLLKGQRDSYEGPWNWWHNVRTAAAVVSLGLAAAACVLSETD